MVVFTCETCYATLKKQQIDKHCETKCRNAWHFTCVECAKTFAGFDYKEHNECMTEVQKYQGQFIERQREMKRQQKEQDKQDKGHEKKEEEQEKKPSLKRFLKKGTKFEGWSETAEKVLSEVNIKIH